MIESQPGRVPAFAVIPGSQVQRSLEGQEQRVVQLVEQAYRLHGRGDTVNPPSCFLRFPGRPAARIIALPASLGGELGVDGIKWISSFPSNLNLGLPRASAVLILNDHETGYPFACLEASIISAVRTAASAALAAARLSDGRERPARAGFFGTGLIARYIHTYLAATGWNFARIGVHDANPSYAAAFRRYLADSAPASEITVHERPEDLIRGSDLLIFATTAGAPHVHEPAWFGHHPLVLHISLRDLAPQVILASANVLDDVDHCLTAGTSAHLAEQSCGHRRFVTGTLPGVLAGTVELPGDRPVVFSPFGLGILDVAVAAHVYQTAAASGELAVVDGFFHDLHRYSRPAAVTGAATAPSRSS
jgi:2,3-diaminopropionate biosynthesis protein SbnB